MPKEIFKMPINITYTHDIKWQLFLKGCNN